MILKVTGISLPPWTFISDLGGGKWTLEGIVKDLFYYTIDSQNVSLEFVTPFSYKLGKISENGSWTGILGMMQNGIVDMLVNPVVTTTFSMNEAVLTNGFSTTDFVILSGKPDGYKSDPWSYLYVFDGDVWLLIGISFILLSILLSIVEYLHTENKEFQFVKYIWSIFGIMTFQASVWLPRLAKSRLLFGLWCLLAMVLMEVFSTTMIAEFSAEDEPRRIDSFQDIIDRPHLRPIIPVDSALKEYFQFSREKSIRKVWQQMNVRKGVASWKEYLSLDILEDVYVGKSVLIMESVIAHYQLRHVCHRDKDYYFGNERFMPTSGVYCVSERLPSDFVENVNQRIVSYVSYGHFEYQLLKITSSLEKCLSKDQGHHEKSLKLKSIVPAAILWGLGVSVSIVVFLLELGFMCYSSKIFKSL